jgi:hypothetical protein
MKRTDKIIIGVLIGFILPVSVVYFSFTVWFCFFQSFKPFYFAVSGFIIGFVLDLLFLKKLITRALELPLWMLILIYLLYNIVIYSVFMGFPVFNLATGVVAGYYTGIKQDYKKLPETENQVAIRKVSFFTAFVMLLICVCTATLALLEKSIGLELQNMLGLKFEVTKGMIIAIILAGGISLIAIQYRVTKIVFKITMRLRISGLYS